MGAPLSAGQVEIVSNPDCGGPTARGEPPQAVGVGAFAILITLFVGIGVLLRDME